MCIYCVFALGGLVGLATTAKNMMDAKNAPRAKNFEDIDGASSTCEACGSSPLEVKCKLVCSKCGYFRSCSDLF